MEAFRPLRTRTHVPALQRRHPEERFWNAYDRQVCVRFDGAVQAIDFSPIDANQIAVTAESRILVLDAGTGEVRKRFARTDTVAYGGRYRADGKLLVAGTDSGLVHIYNANSRSILRTFSGHKSAVRKTHFTIDKLRVVSASDDMTVRVTDLPTERCLLSIPHSDRVRAQASCTAAPHLWLTGCYDGGVRLFDLRVPNATPVRMIWHARNEQVDDVCFISGESSTLIASAGGPYVRLWDLLQSDGQEQRHSGQMMVAEAERHRKAVMALAVDMQRHRLLSVSLDGTLKVHELGTMMTLHTMHVGVGCLCLNLSADGHVLATGQVDGLLRLQQRVGKASAVAETATRTETTREEHDFVRLARGHMDRGDPSRPYRPGTRRYFLRGMHLEPEPAVDDDIIIR
ncbi:snoRNA-binding rRNA-processing protein [Cyanidiococcus yangmingshanensis]|uniref:SnoRNA-binding rRNA-processing protein n=1 Tax=Cyanidiococcus yangmingshanensis TaxID=2690220 RepID=A0A7J7ILG3_9RHOD|nr:snoRNA-binding rRNA-processing protein [Cyanidiococcus yangmingshanensis]